MTIDEFSKNLIQQAIFELDEGMKQARKNVGASTCWDGYTAKGTKKKDGKEVPNCVKEEDIEEEKKKGLWDNIHAKRERGEAPAKKGEKGYPKTLNVEAKDMPGNQEKIDANKNGKVDAHDFALLRARKAKKSVKEMWEKAAEVQEGYGKSKKKAVDEGKKVEIEVMPDVDIPNDPEKETGKKAKKEKELKKEEVEILDEKKLSKAEAAKKEKFVKGMKKKFGSFKSKYGDRAKEVMYGTATTMAKKSA